MKKIIIVNNDLKTGGVQISLLNLLEEIKQLYDITLFVFNCTKNEIERIPQGIKVIYANSPIRYLGMSQAEAKESFSTFVGRSFWAILTKIFGRSNVIKVMMLFQKDLSDFDYAISYLHEANQKAFYGGCNEFVLKKIHAKKKVAWLHCDFRLCGANSKKSREIYSQFDTIVACSEGSKNSFVECFPEMRDKCVSVRNCNNFEAIRSCAIPPIFYDDNVFNVVTVARLSSEKGIDRMIEVMSKAKKSKRCIHYHVIGAGPQQQSLSAKAVELNVSDVVTFYGNKENPYPYIAGADLFVLPSYQEAAPMVFDEAACLGIPVLTTETTSAKEMIVDCSHGIVCENDTKALCLALFHIYDNPKSIENIRHRLSEEEFSNERSINQLRNAIK